MRRFTWILTTLLAAFGVQADTIREVSIHSTADSNIFGTAEAPSDYLTEVSTYLAETFEGDGLETRIFYDGAGYLFASSGNRSFTTQEVGIAHVRRLGAGRNRLYAGVSFRTRIDRADFDVYDNAGMRAFLNAKLYATPQTMVHIGYHLTTRNYWNLDSSGYADHYVFGQMTRFTASRTTLRADASYSYKTHVSAEGQVVLGAQVAQSVGAGTGISVRYQRRVNTIAPTADATLDGFSLDEDILVDRYDYGGHALTLRVTQQLPARTTLVLEAGYESQRYDGQVALDAGGLPLADLALRRDRITFGRVGLEIPVGDRFELGADYRYESSRSNDVYYDYRGRRSLSLSLGLQF